jgi:putative ABC transport system permease protein
VTSPSFKLEDVRAIDKQLTAVSRVAATSSRACFAVYGDKNWTTTVTGSTSEYFRIRGYRVATGSEFSEGEAGAGASLCVLGDTVRRRLFGFQDPVDAMIRIGGAACKVIGALEAKGQSAFGADQDDFIIMPLAAFQRRIAGNAEVGAIFVNAVGDNETERAKLQLQSLMRERRRLPPGTADDFQVQDMKEITRTLGNVTGALTALLGAIAGVSLLVGGIGIMNIMLVSVTERTREIGLRLAIGARARDVLIQFLIEAMVLSSLGGVLGMSLGLGGSYVGARAIGLPFEMAANILGVAFGFSSMVGIGFGFLPARRAAGLNPIEALRHG